MELAFQCQIPLRIKQFGHNQKVKKKVVDFLKQESVHYFDLNTGVALSYRMSNKKSHELPLLRDQMDTFVEGDVFLGDKDL